LPVVQASAWFEEALSVAGDDLDAASPAQLTGSSSDHPYSMEKSFTER
jgi:hypothetical protein